MRYGCRMTKKPPRRVIGDEPAWKAMAHPLRGEILRQLDRLGRANSTRIAEELGENTGTTSYHLRVLADAGVIEEIPELSQGRQRWWRAVRVDRREPPYDSLSGQERAALDAWRDAQLPGEIELFNRFIAEFRKHGEWAKGARGGGYFTEQGLAAVFEGFIQLLNEHAHSVDDAPEGARQMRLRMFYLPAHGGST